MKNNSNDVPALTEKTKADPCSDAAQELQEEEDANPLGITTKSESLVAGRDEKKDNEAPSASNKTSIPDAYFSPEQQLEQARGEKAAAKTVEASATNYKTSIPHAYFTPEQQQEQARGEKAAAKTIEASATNYKTSIPDAYFSPEQQQEQSRGAIHAAEAIGIATLSKLPDNTDSAVVDITTTTPLLHRGTPLRGILEPGAYQFQPGVEPTRVQTVEYSRITTVSNDYDSTIAVPNDTPSQQQVALAKANPVQTETEPEQKLPWALQINFCGTNCNIKSTSKWDTTEGEPAQGLGKRKGPWKQFLMSEVAPVGSMANRFCPFDLMKRRYQKKQAKKAALRRAASNRTAATTTTVQP